MPAPVVDLGLMLALLLLCFLGGGGSRNDVTSLLYLQPAAAVLLVVAAARARVEDMRTLRTPLLLLALFAAIHVAQLIPLPPAIWEQLPGRAMFAETAAAIGQPATWRPISIAPDLTLASLIGLIVPAAAMLLAARLRTSQHELLLWVLAAGVLVSVLLGALQLTAGEESPYHLYEITNNGIAVGLFANRNHQAALLAAAMPLLAVLLSSTSTQRLGSVWRLAITIGGCLLLMIMILVTGSRAGLALAIVGIASAGALFRPGRLGGPKGRRYALLLIIVSVVAVSALYGLLNYQRASTLTRLTGREYASESRIANFGLYVQMVKDHFLLGSGLGTFDPLFRIYEPFQDLKPTYLNHAHNDLMELLMTGGLAAAALLVGFLAWFARRSMEAFRARDRLALLGAVFVLILLLASTADYPLRTPLLGCLFGVCVTWLSTTRQADKSPANSVASGPRHHSYSSARAAARDHVHK
ncbi:MAG: O-antigen ligase family protein [Sphingomonas sp.]|uniref:O-antigen ligase family protein n=1 Tax=Sphingomonas sp. TaxID=28214 RepID=UPI001B022E1D|nr:O-antigen ligase family protein [Sphingomonas sp.]MBO9622433.1 O-antigen ligase family protein [Sphingomonas sp.]